MTSILEVASDDEDDDLPQRTAVRPRLYSTSVEQKNKDAADAIAAQQAAADADSVQQAAADADLQQRAHAAAAAAQRQQQVVDPQELICFFEEGELASCDACGQRLKAPVRCNVMVCPKCKHRVAAAAWKEKQRPLVSRSTLWDVAWSKSSSRWYWWHSESRETSWECPEEETEAAAAIRNLVEKYTPTQLEKAARKAHEKEAAFIRALDGLTVTKLNNFAVLVSQKEGAPDLLAGVWGTSGAGGKSECHFEEGQALDYIRDVWARCPTVFTADGRMKPVYTAKTPKGKVLVPKKMSAIVDGDGKFIQGSIWKGSSAGEFSQKKINNLHFQVSDQGIDPVMLHVATSAARWSSTPQKRTGVAGGGECEAAAAAAPTLPLPNASAD